MIVISKEQIIDLHKQLIEETGGSHGLRDEGLLDSAYNAPFQKFDNQELFPTIQQKSKSRMPPWAKRKLSLRVTC